MNIQAATMSLSAFPIGMGLTTAAHVHLCQRNIARAEKYRSQYQLQHNISQLDMLSQSLEDLNALTDMIDNLNTVLDRFSSPRTHKRRTRRPRPLGQARSKTSDAHDPAERSLGNTSQEPSPGSTADPTDRDSSRRFNELHKSRESDPYNDGDSMIPATLGDGPAASEHRAESASGPRTRRHCRAGSSARIIDIPVEELEQWTKVYKTLRISQEQCNGRTFEQLRRTMPSAFLLKNELVFSFLLSSATMLRFLCSTKGFSAFFAKHTVRFRSLVSWIPWPWSPPSSSYIPWGLAPNSSQTTGQNMDALVSGTANDPGAARASGVSVAFAFLPLVPTLFVSGIHFLAAARSHWTLRNMQKDMDRKRQFIKRLEVLSLFLLIRELRLKWLVEEIEAYDADEALREQSEDNDEDAFVNSAIADPSSATRPGSADPPTLLAPGLNNRVYSLLQDREGDLGSRSRNSNDRRRQQQPPPRSGQQGSSSRTRASSDLKFSTFGPDLENMDMDLFLRDARERSRILRLEFEGMHQELTLFRGLLLPLRSRST
ncbi:hypothetical protein BGZ70_003252 [Mortierella alpina]|uniref:Uncharacterized protein n=1 Tax=Mortierella alpina TaxID=64518 RepID=A0A9P6JAV7_MORAP|nr:hypothetical protein BGZ70_003252 [Mortierella alpina]